MLIVSVKIKLFGTLSSGTEFQSLEVFLLVKIAFVYNAVAKTESFEDIVQHIFITFNT